MTEKPQPTETEKPQLTEFSRFAARLLLPPALLTAGLPLMPAHTVMHPQGTSVVAQSILHQPDEPSRQEQAPNFGWATPGITSSLQYTFTTTSGDGRVFGFVPRVTQGRFFWLK
jgi:hypothetical protein